MVLIGTEILACGLHFIINFFICNIFSCALSFGNLACFDVAGKLNIASLTKANKDRLSVDINGGQIKAILGSPIPAFTITNSNVEKLVYVKDNTVHIRSLTTKASSFIYTYMADRHILLQVFSPTQVCSIKYIQFLFGLIMKFNTFCF